MLNQKVVVRNLPIELTQEHFSSFIPEESRLLAYRTGNPGRAYLSFEDSKSLVGFYDSFNKHAFITTNPKVYHASVELAPFQRIYRDGEERINKSENTIESDLDYLEFIQSIGRKVDDASIEQAEMDPSLKENKMTPLIEGLKARKEFLRLQEENDRQMSKSRSRLDESSRKERKRELVSIRTNVKNDKINKEQTKNGQVPQKAEAKAQRNRESKEAKKAKKNTLKTQRKVHDSKPIGSKVFGSQVDTSHTTDSDIIVDSKLANSKPVILSIQARPLVINKMVKEILKAPNVIKVPIVIKRNTIDRQAVIKE